MYSLPRVKKLCFSLNASNSGEKLTFFPTSRYRYVRLFPNEVFSKTLNFHRINPIQLCYISKKLKRRTQILVSSEMIHASASNRLDSLDKFDVSVFIWNDELEIEAINASCKLEINEFVSFFNLGELLPDSKVSVLKFGNTYSSLPGTKSSKIFNKEGGVFFAGQVNPNLYDNLIQSQQLHHAVNEARELVLQSRDPFTLFYYGQFWDKFDGMTLTEIVAIRHKVMNEWRLSVFKELVNELGPRLHLMGSDFESPVFKGARIIPGKENLSDIYKSSRINLDLGSQCGAEYIYPRTLEILYSNPESLAPFERRGQIAKLPISLMTWNSVSDILEICQGKQVI